MLAASDFAGGSGAPNTAAAPSCSFSCDAPNVAIDLYFVACVRLQTGPAALFACSLRLGSNATWPAEQQSRFTRLRRTADAPIIQATVDTNLVPGCSLLRLCDRGMVFGREVPQTLLVLFLALFMCSSVALLSHRRLREPQVSFSVLVTPNPPGAGLQTTKHQSPGTRRPQSAGGHLSPRPNMITRVRKRASAYLHHA